ncbi:hypothetical protein GUITHDRAFT_166278 [Guillardia theta CCMP2712]|uniref:Uncharacterized protein n=1 Tax=Guillardia theta (strain CCMP2712) TaxID=905079 RepID=L1ID92_GUITC|nr:hypothetical protein GUITHDRAFT_166278 [Guillardia theta CCMP2712]EKX34213.1 hypothetical protein GUITHDRAFT_166278 [Guillardia theta CCMP2712]|eukprot:XP_005821193.1 hypothetical protein GUITHDRAFT_166278 [Guillardia theta CCMP2712]
MRVFRPLNPHLNPSRSSMLAGATSLEQIRSSFSPADYMLLMQHTDAAIQQIDSFCEQARSMQGWGLRDPHMAQEARLLLSSLESSHKIIVRLYSQAAASCETSEAPLRKWWTDWSSLCSQPAASLLQRYTSSRSSILTTRTLPTFYTKGMTIMLGCLRKNGLRVTEEVHLVRDSEQHDHEPCLGFTYLMTAGDQRTAQLYDEVMKLRRKQGAVKSLFHSAEYSAELDDYIATQKRISRYASSTVDMAQPYMQQLRQDMRHNQELWGDRWNLDVSFMIHDEQSSAASALRLSNSTTTRPSSAMLRPSTCCARPTGSPSTLSP